MFPVSHYQQNELQRANFRVGKLHTSILRPHCQQRCQCGCWVNVNVKYTLLLATVSLAVAVNVTVRMALFWACQTASVSSLPQGSPRSINARKVWALWTDCCSLGSRRSCHFHFSIFRTVMSERGLLRHPRDWQRGHMLFPLKSGYADSSLGSGASRLQLSRQKIKPTALQTQRAPSLLFSVPSTFFFFFLLLGRKVLSWPCEIVSALWRFCLSPIV